jgi:hypothetical protein
MKTAADIIEVLDGAASIARKTGFPLSTVASWKAANFIPEWRRPALIKLGKGKIRAEDFPPETARVSRKQAA